jgi:hypothetical protein
MKQLKQHPPLIIAKSFALTGFTALSLVTVTPVEAITLIDTTSSWDGTNIIEPFGGGIGVTSGQTVTAPTVDNVLNSFSFILGPFLYDYGNPVTFQGYVAQWDGSKATGPILYQSADQTYSGGGFQTYNFNTGSLALIPAQKYVLFLYASPTSGNTQQAFISDSGTYSGGNFVFSHSNFEELTTTNWNGKEGIIRGDAAFTASFRAPVAVPWETDALPVLGSTVLFGLGIWWKSKPAQRKNNKKD